MGESSREPTSPRVLDADSCAITPRGWVMKREKQVGIIMDLGKPIDVTSLDYHGRNNLCTKWSISWLRFIKKCITWGRQTRKHVKVSWWEFPFVRFWGGLEGSRGVWARRANPELDVSISFRKPTFTSEQDRWLLCPLINYLGSVYWESPLPQTAGEWSRKEHLGRRTCEFFRNREFWCSRNDSNVYENG